MSSTVRPDKGGAAAAAAARKEKNAELARAADDMRQRNASGATADTETKEPPPPPREDVESVEWKLTDGRVVHFGPPPGVSLTMRIALTFPDATPVIDRLARILLSIRSIDGHPMKVITNQVELIMAANGVGDLAIDELNAVFDRHWGVVRLTDLQLLKKNLRQS